MKVGENPLYTIMARYLELATEVVLEPPSSFTRPHLLLQADVRHGVLDLGRSS